LAFGFTLATIRKFLRPLSYKFVISLIMILFLANFNRYIPWFNPRLSLRPDYLDSMRWNMVRKIPNDVPALATFDFLAELSNRKELYALHKLYLYGYRDVFHVPDNVNWALIDFNDRWLEDAYFAEPKETALHLQKFLIDNDWGMEQAAEDIVLLKKGNKQKIVEIDTVAPDIRYNKIYSELNDQLSVGQTQTIPRVVKKGQILPLKLEWFAAQDIKKDYVLQILITQGQRIAAVRTHSLGYKILPSFMWTKGSYIHERYSLCIPDLPEAEYTLKLRILDADTNIAEPITQILSTITIQ
jgi:hypothetical protein